VSENDPQENAKNLGELIKRIMDQAKGVGNSDVKPFTTDLRDELSNVKKPSEEINILTDIAFIKSHTFLDDFFLDVNEKPIGGIPKVSQIAVVGLPDSGKSLLAQEFALRIAASGRKVVFVTSEDIFDAHNDRFDLQKRMKVKADLLKLDWKTIRENLYVIDTVSTSLLRDWDSFVTTYRTVVEKEKVEYLVMDSLTLVEDYRGAIKNRLLELVRYNQIHGVTAFYVSQRSTEDADKFGMAGGIGLGHVLDVVFALDYQKIWSGDSQMKLDMGLKQNDFTRFIRCIKCRLCMFDAKYHRIEITKEGLITVLPPKEPEVKT